MAGSTRVQKRKSIRLPRKFTPKFWAEVDGRFGAKREILKRYRQLKEDSGADSYQKQLLCQRAAFVSIQLETMEREAADGEPFDAGVYTQSVNALTGILMKLGLLKKSAVGQDLKSYLQRA